MVRWMEPGNIGSQSCVDVYIVAAFNLPSNPEDPIRRFAVGLLALAAIAAAGILLTRRRPSLSAVRDDTTRKPVEDLYAAGL